MIMAPLTKLLHKGGFQWCPDAENAFCAVQHVLSTAPVFHLLDFNKLFVVECDASGSGLGAVLHQGMGLVAFFSQPVTARHAKLTDYEHELIGLVQAVRHWQPYLWGRAFMIKNDHYSLEFLLDQCLSTIPEHQWARKLLGIDF
jgi:hypothetical protein